MWRFRDGFVDGFVMVSWRFRKSTKPATKPPLFEGKRHETGIYALRYQILHTRKRAGLVSWPLLHAFVICDGFVMVSFGFGRFRTVSSGFVRFFPPFIEKDKRIKDRKRRARNQTYTPQISAFCIIIFMLPFIIMF